MLVEDFRCCLIHIPRSSCSVAWRLITGSRNRIAPALPVCVDAHAFHPGLKASIFPRQAEALFFIPDSARDTCHVCGPCCGELGDAALEDRPLTVICLHL